MEFSEIISSLDEFKDTEEFNNYVNGFINGDRVQKFLETDEGKKLVQPIIDKNFSKGLETWKTNNLDKAVDEEIKRRFPETDEKDAELAKLQSEIDKIKKESLHKDLSNKALKIATEKKLPVDLINFFIGEDEKTTLENIDAFEKVFNDSLASNLDSKIKDNSYAPPADNKNKNTDPFIDGLRNV